MVERGVCAGRDQDWNISRKELDEVVEMGVLSAEEAEEVGVRVPARGRPDRAEHHEERRRSMLRRSLSTSLASH